MQTVACIEKYAKPLIYLDSSALLKDIQTIMFSKNVSHIPIIDENHGQYTNAYVIRRKTIWSWMYRNDGASPTVGDVREKPLPVVNRDDSLASAMKDLVGVSAVLIRGDDGDFTHILSPRNVADALRDYSEKFQVIEQLEGALRRRLSSFSGEDLANAVRFKSEQPLESGEMPETVSIDSLSFDKYEQAFGRLWAQIGLTYLDKKFVLRLMNTARRYRNEVMHFRLQGNEEGLEAVKELLGLLNATPGK